VLEVVPLEPPLLEGGFAAARPACACVVVELLAPAVLVGACLPAPAAPVSGVPALLPGCTAFEPQPSHNSVASVIAKVLMRIIAMSCGAGPAFLYSVATTQPPASKFNPSKSCLNRSGQIRALRMMGCPMGISRFSRRQSGFGVRLYVHTRGAAGERSGYA
jgi:hypothetical protein